MTKPVERKVVDAINTIADQLQGSLHVGSEFSGVLSPFGDADIEITVRVKPRVSLQQSSHYRERALLLLAADAWHDRCPHYVKNREWSPGSKTHECRHKVTTAIVRSGHGSLIGPIRQGEYRPMVPTERFEFACRVHADVNAPDVVAVVRLEQAALSAIRAKHKREADARAALARAKEQALELELRTVPDSELARRLAEFVAAGSWTSEDVCRREQWRREREQRNAKPADLPVSEHARRGA